MLGLNSHFRAESIKNDLTMGKERPIWPLTSYGPAKFEPTLLTGLDESPEELRVRATAALKAGNINEYVRLALVGQKSHSHGFSLAMSPLKWPQLSRCSRCVFPMYLSWIIN